MNEETLTLNDLLQIQKIIDVAVQRGAFKAEETRIVGETYEKISSFLQSIQPEESEESPSEDNDQTNMPLDGETKEENS